MFFLEKLSATASGKTVAAVFSCHFWCVYAEGCLERSKPNWVVRPLSLLVVWGDTHLAQLETFSSRTSSWIKSQPGPSHFCYSLDGLTITILNASHGCWGLNRAQRIWLLYMLGQLRWLQSLDLTSYTCVHLNFFSDYRYGQCWAGGNGLFGKE